jgi:hypothetical protein
MVVNVSEVAGGAADKMRRIYGEKDYGWTRQ